MSELTLVDGRLDVEAIAAVEEPLLDLQNALVALEDAAERVQSPWLVAPLQRQLDNLDEDIAENRPRLQTTIDAARLAPALLGADGERRYLVRVHLAGRSPRDRRILRQLGRAGRRRRGTVRRGRSAGRANSNQMLGADGSECSGCSEEFLTYYGSYGFTTGPGGTARSPAWSNITSPTHFPYAAEAIASLYPDSGGRAIDGVIAMDPYVLAELMRYTGPIEVPELDVLVAGRGRRRVPARRPVRRSPRRTAFASRRSKRSGSTAITRILSADLPDPPELGAGIRTPRRRAPTAHVDIRPHRTSLPRARSACSATSHRWIPQTPGSR